MTSTSHAGIGLLLVTLLLSATAASQQDQSAPTFDGTWGGWIDLAGDRSWFQLRNQDGSLFLEDFNTNRGGQVARGIDVSDGRLRFVYDAPIGPVRFAGSIEGRTLTGELRANGYAPGRF